MHKQRVVGILLAGLVVASVVATGVGAQAITPEAALSRLCTHSVFSPDWFAPSLLAQVPWQPSSSSLRTSPGRWVGVLRVSQTGNQYALVFEHGVFVARAQNQAC